MAFWGQIKTGQKIDADELDWLSYLAESSKSYCTLLVLIIFIHFTQSRTLLWVKWTKILKTDSVYCDISISCIFFKFPHQIRIKKVVKCWKNFSWYSATLGKHHVLFDSWNLINKNQKRNPQPIWDLFLIICFVGWCF